MHKMWMVQCALCAAHKLQACSNLTNMFTVSGGAVGSKSRATTCLLSWPCWDLGAEPVSRQETSQKPSKLYSSTLCY